MRVKKKWKQKVRICAGIGVAAWILGPASGLANPVLWDRFGGRGSVTRSPYPYLVRGDRRARRLAAGGLERFFEKRLEALGVEVEAQRVAVYAIDQAAGLVFVEHLQAIDVGDPAVAGLAALLDEVAGGAAF